MRSVPMRTNLVATTSAHFLKSSCAEKGQILASISTCNYSSSWTPLHVLPRLARAFFQAAHLSPRANRRLRHTCKPPATGDKGLGRLGAVRQLSRIQSCRTCPNWSGCKFCCLCGKFGCPSTDRQIFLRPDTCMLKLRS